MEALIEGQATLVARSACGSRAGADLSDGVTEVDIVSSLDPDVEQSFEYGYGRRYVEGLVAPFGDHRAVWVAFQTPPTKQEILRSVRETLAPRWNDLTPLSEVTQALADGAEVVTEGTVSPAELLGGLSAGGVSVSSMFPAEGGLISRRSDERNSAMAAVFLLEKPNDAVKWVAARRGDVASGTMRMYAGKVGYIQRRAVRDQHPAFKESALDRMFGATVFLSSRGQYRELWLARGNVLVGLSSWALAGNAPKLETAALSLLDAYRDNLPTPPVATTAPPEAPPPLRSGRFVIDRMLSLAVAGDLAGCAALAATNAPSVWEAQRGRVYQVGYMCAARVENVATCDALLAADDFRPDYNDAVRHANLLRGTPRQADGIAILERSIATGAQARQYRESALAETYADIKRWADVRRVLNEGDPLPRSRIHAATALYNSGAKAEARALAKPACAVGDASQKAAAICR